MWGLYSHHILLHFPIVLPFVISVIGILALVTQTDDTQPLLRWFGWATFILTTLTVVTGLVGAPGWIGEEGSQTLGNHRNLGLTVWVLAGIAAKTFDIGVKTDAGDWRKFAVGVWCVTAFTVVGTGHWGGSEVHADKIPWQEQKGPEAENASKKNPEHQ